MGNRGSSNKPDPNYSFSNEFFGVGPRDRKQGVGFAGFYSKQMFKDGARAEKFKANYLGGKAFQDQEAIFQSLIKDEFLDMETAQYFREQSAAADTRQKREAVYGQLVKSITGNDENDATLLDLKRAGKIKEKIKDQPGLRAQTMLGARTMAPSGKIDTRTDEEMP